MIIIIFIQVFYPPMQFVFNVIVQIITVTRSLKSKSLFASIGVSQGKCRSS